MNNPESAARRGGATTAVGPAGSAVATSRPAPQIHPAYGGYLEIEDAREAARRGLPVGKGWRLVGYCEHKGCGEPLVVSTSGFKTQMRCTAHLQPDPLAW